MLSVRPLLLECARQNRVTDYQLTAIIANDLRDQSPNIQCLSLCFFQKLGMMDENGNVNLERTIASFSLGEDSLNVSRDPFIISFLTTFIKGNPSGSTMQRSERLQSLSYIITNIWLLCAKWSVINMCHANFIYKVRNSN